MKITKRQLKKIIAEEVEKLLNENYSEDILPGDYLEISVSDDGYDVGVQKVNPAEYQNTKSPYHSLKALVKVEQVAAMSEDY
mgnify:CR=1 FL=1